MKERVIKYEAILNESEQVLANVKQALNRLAEHQEAYNELKAYYGSEEYFEDLDEEATYPERYEGVARGVLTEDAVFNHIVDSRETYIDMLELLAQLFREH